MKQAVPMMGRPLALGVTMGVKGRLRTMEGGKVGFKCPGCGEIHVLAIRCDSQRQSPSWEFNGDHQNPTFSPSILVASGHYASGFKQGMECWCTYYAKNQKEAEEDGDDKFKCYRCHSFVRNGRIQFLDDCTHHLKGQTVELPAIDNG